MSVEEWGDPFNVRCVTNVPYYMEVAEWGLAGRCKGEEVNGMRQDMSYARPSCDT